MRGKQSGFTLVELILVIGLMSMAMILSFKEKQQELEAMKAKGTGEILFQYNNAARSWLANNIGAPSSVKHGSAWLKHTSCAGGTSSIAYLPCNFPAATTVSPISFGNIALTSYVDSTGAYPNQVTSVRTDTTPFVIKGQPRANLSGIAAIVAAAGKTDGISPVLMASEGSFSSDPATASITMIASNNASTDAWLRTDGSNFMNNSITFNPSRPVAGREIKNLSRISNITDGIIFAGNAGGASLVFPERFIVDANEEIIGTLKVGNTKGNAVGLEVTQGNVNIPAGNLNASGNVVGKSFRDIDDSLYYVDPNGTSVVRNLNAKAAINADGNISSKQNVSGRVFYDADDNSFYVNPNLLSQLNELATQGSVKVGDYLKLDRISSEGASCAAAGVGAISRDSTGKTLSCQSGVWKAGGNINVGPRTSLAFNVNYCLGFSAFVYAQILGDVRDSMGVEIVVNGAVEAVSKADSEGWKSYESTSTILSANDCFSIRTLTANSKQPIAWFKKL